jgi:ATP/maltotriose-dependent transcriptional regulator MalT
MDIDRSGGTMTDGARAATGYAVAAAYDETLTGREVEILSLVADGLTALAIAHLLRIAEATVRKHLEHIYEKLNRHDRLLAVLHARELGLIP